jgi:hypothetical protein
MAQLLEEIDLTEDKNNGYESDDSIDFETQWSLLSAHNCYVCLITVRHFSLFITCALE